MLAAQACLYFRPWGQSANFAISKMESLPKSVARGKLVFNVRGLRFAGHHVEKALVCESAMYCSAFAFGEF
jgi:hypothetical protein